MPKVFPVAGFSGQPERQINRKETTTFLIGLNATEARPSEALRNEGRSLLLLGLMARAVKVERVAKGMMQATWVKSCLSCSLRFADRGVTNQRFVQSLS